MTAAPPIDTLRRNLEDSLNGYHEAGHAIMALHRGMTVEEMSLYKVANTAAHTLMGQYKEPKDAVFVALAGPTAVQLYASKHPLLFALPADVIMDGCQADLKWARKIMHASGYLPTPTELREIAQFLRQPEIWQQVRALAHALLKKRQLKGDEIAEIVAQVKEKKE